MAALVARELRCPAQQRRKCWCRRHRSGCHRGRPRRTNCPQRCSLQQLVGQLGCKRWHGRQDSRRAMLPTQQRRLTHGHRCDHHFSSAAADCRDVADTARRTARAARSTQLDGGRAGVWGGDGAAGAAAAGVGAGGRDRGAGLATPQAHPAAGSRHHGPLSEPVPEGLGECKLLPKGGAGAGGEAEPLRRLAGTGDHHGLVGSSHVACMVRH